MKIPWFIILILVLIVFLLPDPLRWGQAQAPVLLPNTPAPAAQEASSAPLINAPAVTAAAPEEHALPDTSTEPPKALGQGVVNTHNLYLRMGPGTSYQALRLMPKGLALDIHGRNGNGQWLEVRLPDGTGGWAAAEYVDADVSLAGLPVTEAHGGLPAAEPAKAFESAPDQNDVEVNITGSQAELRLHNFPANTAVVVTMKKAGKGGVWTVARASTEATGLANLAFHIPDELAGEGELTLTASTTDGSFSQTANVQYSNH